MLQRVTKALRLHVESDSCRSARVFVNEEKWTAYRREEGVKELGGVWNEVLVILEYGVDGEHCVLPDEGVSMFLTDQSGVHIHRRDRTHQT